MDGTSPSLGLEDLALPAKGVAVVYDGDCPLCSNFVRSLRIRREFGAIDLIDARQRLDLVAKYLAAGFDLDKGFVCAIDGEVYYGGDAVNVLALVSGGSSLLNRINYWIFGNRAIARLLYPFLRAARNGLLRLRGTKQLNALEH